MMEIKEIMRGDPKKMSLNKKEAAKIAKLGISASKKYGFPLQKKKKKKELSK
jgi:hypothetical protein